MTSTGVGWLDQWWMLLTAIGLSSTSGLRAYLPLLALAIGSQIPGGNGGDLITVAPWLTGVAHSGGLWAAAALLILAFIEFVVDKIPVLDHINDAIHTVIRPVAGGFIMAAIDNPISHNSPWVAAIIGAILAFMVHGVKATTRPVVTATTMGIGNPAVSAGEDILAVLMTLLSVFLPILLIIGLVIVVLIMWKPITRGLGRLFGRGARAGLD
jgi:Domain of unknown function (DUF4126)